MAADSRGEGLSPVTFAGVHAMSGAAGDWLPTG
jgi:hypothetical protein